MLRGPRGDVRLKDAGPLAALLLPLVAFPLLSACVESKDNSDPCERPRSCPERRPLPILY